MTNNKFTFICKITCNYWQVYVGTNTYRCSKYFGLKYRVTVAELQIVIPTLITAAKEIKPDRAYRHNRCWNLGCQGKGFNGGLVSPWLGHGLAQSRRSKAISLLHSVN